MRGVSAIRRRARAGDDRLRMPVAIVSTSLAGGLQPAQRAYRERVTELPAHGVKIFIRLIFCSARCVGVYHRLASVAPHSNDVYLADERTPVSQLRDRCFRKEVPVGDTPDVIAPLGVRPRFARPCRSRRGRQRRHGATMTPAAAEPLASITKATVTVSAAPASLPTR